MTLKEKVLYYCAFFPHRADLATNAECLNSLRFDNTRYREIPDAHEATLEWLWTHEKYRKWSESDSSTLLYIEGKPGSGKSTLAKYFKDNLLRREPKANVASFFYSRRDGDRHASHYSMLRSLLYDILSQCESFFPLLQQDYRQYQDLRPERDGWPCFSLKKALLSLGNHRRVERLYLIIDALDESDSKDRRDIVQLLLKLCSTKSVKIFVTSRPVVELSSYFTGSHHVIRMQDENEPDIRHFVDSFIPGIGFSESALSQVRKYILENAQGVFLWVRLVKDNLYSYTEVGCTMSEIFNFLRSLPRELEGLYEPIVQGLERNDKDVADTRKMLQFVLFARRPLTVSELQHALAIPNDPDAKLKHSIESFEDNQIVGIEKRIIHCGGNLIEIKGHGGITSVQLMHQTVREFFLRPGVSTAAPRLSMSENDAHLRIAIACIRYLTLCSGQAATHGAESQHVDAWEPESFKAYVRYLHQRPLINYALNHLEDHFRKCTDATNLSDIISQLAGELTPGSAPYYLLESWITPYLNKSPSREMAGAAQDFRNKILLAAARTGYYRVAEALLIAGAQINIQDSDDGSTALHLAAKQGHEATVRLLLEKGANTKVKDHDGKTAPHRGATVQLLLDHGANTETRDSDDGSTTPHQVTEQRRKSMIRLPPSDEAKFNDGIPALPRGAKRWRTDTVRVVDKSH